MSQKQVGIVILNWNGTEDTLECLGSLQQLNYTNYIVYVIDNGSSVPCTEAVKTSFPQVQVIELSENLGFAGGCNIGIRQALADGAEYVWLLNNDTVVDPNALTAMVEVAENDSRCGIVGSKILYYDKPKVINHAGGRIHPWLGRSEHIGCGEIDRGQFDKVRQVDYVTGCSLLAKKTMIESVGFMDEAYFLYWEESDWCIRAKQKGWQIKYAPRSVVYHKISQSLGQKSPIMTYYMARNTLVFLRKYFPYMFPIAGLWWLRFFFFNNLFKRRMHHLRMALVGMLDFLKGELGMLNR